ncbi:MAG: insulinase family protein [Planctomycetes bacterium]|nr:insulinase family protein [Planctomycetota bacterium]
MRSRSSSGRRLLRVAVVAAHLLVGALLSTPLPAQEKPAQGGATQAKPAQGKPAPGKQGQGQQPQGKPSQGKPQPGQPAQGKQAQGKQAQGNKPAGKQAQARKGQAKKEPTGPVSFRTPDGSRCVLVPLPGTAQVHWVVATPAGADVEPRGLAGIVPALQKASLNGTRAIGSLDPDAEQSALEALDAAYAELLAAPGTPALMQRVAECQQRADALGDKTVFTRILAAAPAHEPAIDIRDPVALFQLTTLPSAIGEVASILVDRREHPVLRGLPGEWLKELAQRQNAFDRDRLAPVHTELLALAMPDHPAASGTARPGHSMPRRAQAIEVWNATQHPSRTVHVLLGDFDPSAVREVLERQFATTALPTPPPLTATPPKPIRSQRRSTVPGTGRSMVVLAWVLPPISDPLTLSAAVAWLNSGPTSRISRILARSERPTATVACRAPWPIAIAGRSLLLIEASDTAGTEGLAELVLTACANVTTTPPSKGELYSTSMQLQRNWTMITAEPRRFAAETAQAAMLWPQLPPNTTRPLLVDAAAVHKLLKDTFAGQPVIVEARP